MIKKNKHDQYFGVKFTTILRGSLQSVVHIDSGHAVIVPDTVKESTFTATCLKLCAELFTGG